MFLIHATWIHFHSTFIVNHLSSFVRGSSQGTYHFTYLVPQELLRNGDERRNREQGLQRLKHRVPKPLEGRPRRPPVSGVRTILASRECAKQQQKFLPTKQKIKRGSSGSFWQAVSVPEGESSTTAGMPSILNKGHQLSFFRQKTTKLDSIYSRKGRKPKCSWTKGGSNPRIFKITRRKSRLDVCPIISKSFTIIF